MDDKKVPQITSDEVYSASEVPPNNPRKPTRRKKLLLAGLIAIAVVLLAITLAYAYWFQNPNKVVSDALIHAINAKSTTYTGTVTVAGPTKMVATVNGGVVSDAGTLNARLAYEVGGKKYSIDGNAIIDKKNDVYFRVKNIDSLVNNYRQAIPADSLGLFDQVIDTIDDKWIKVSAEDVKSFSPDLLKQKECLNDIAADMQNDNTVRNELVDLYKKHPFITIDRTLGAKDGSLGYVLKTNDQAEVSFAKEIKNTAFYKSLVKCDSNFAAKSDDQLRQFTDGLGAKDGVELWVDRWSHQVTRIAFSQRGTDQTTNISIEPKLNRPVAVVTPKESTTVDQLQKDIQSLLQGPQPASPAQ